MTTVATELYQRGVAKGRLAHKIGWNLSIQNNRVLGVSGNPVQPENEDFHEGWIAGWQAAQQECFQRQATGRRNRRKQEAEDGI